MIFRQVMTTNVVRNKKKSQKIKQIDVNQNLFSKQFFVLIIYFLNESTKNKKNKITTKMTTI